MRLHMNEKVRRAVFLGAFVLGVLHFGVALLAWIVGGFVVPASTRDRTDWPMLLHGIPAVLFLSISIFGFLSARRKQMCRAGVLLAVLLIGSVSLCFIERKYDLYQMLIPGTSQARHYFYNCWWYPKTVKFPSRAYKKRCIDKKGTEVFEVQYDNIYRFSEGFALVEAGGKQGYIDTEGKLVISGRFDDARTFHEGLAVVTIDGRCGYVDKNGEFAIEPGFDGAGDFSEGLAATKVGAKWGYIDRQGQVVIKYQFDWAGEFSEGLATVGCYSARKLGYIDKEGQFVIQETFDDASRFSNDRAAVRIGDKWGYIDRTGRAVVKPQFDYAQDFRNGIARVQNDNGRSGYRSARTTHYIDELGNRLFDLRSGMGLGFSEGLAAVKLGSKWGYVDNRGEVVIAPQFDGALSFSEGLAPVCIGGKWGYIDKAGKRVIEPQFDMAGLFSDGVAIVGMEVTR